MIFKPPTSFVLFQQRRQRFIQKIQEVYKGSSGVVIVGAGFEESRHLFRQSSSFYYLTGITEPAGILCLYLDGREILYVPKYATPRSQWATVTVGGPEDAAKVGIAEVRYAGGSVPGYSFHPVFRHEHYDKLVADLAGFLKDDPAGKVFTLLDPVREEYLLHINWFEHLQRWQPEIVKRTTDISPVLHGMRSIKDEYEVDMIYKAVQITNMAHKAGASLITHDMHEYELQAAIECIFMQVAGATPAFPSIVATGKNATILHYTSHGGQLKIGDLAVVDIGAEYGMYAADLTRTYPVSGKFTPRQREVYQAVLDTQAHIESLARPGMYLRNEKQPDLSLHHLALKYLESRGMAKYFCHGIGHHLGLEVHDVGDMQVPLQQGNVFTIEPGIYIPDENLGVRIEDNFVMAEDGAVCLSFELPKSASEVERMMADKG